MRADGDGSSKGFGVKGKGRAEIFIKISVTGCDNSLRMVWRVD